MDEISRNMTGDLISEEGRRRAKLVGLSGHCEFGAETVSEIRVGIRSCWLAMRLSLGLREFSSNQLDINVEIAWGICDFYLVLRYPGSYQDEKMDVHPAVVRHRFELVCAWTAAGGLRSHRTPWPSNLTMIPHAFARVSAGCQGCVCSKAVLGF